MGKTWRVESSVSIKILVCKDKFHWMALIKKKTWSDDGLIVNRAETIYLENLCMCFVRCVLINIPAVTYLHNQCHVVCTGSN